MDRWLKALREGRAEAAWDAFLERYRKLVFSAIRHYARDYDDVMDVFARVCESLREDDLRRLRTWADQEPHRARFSTWLVTVVDHLTVDWFRHRDGGRRLSAVAQLELRRGDYPAARSAFEEAPGILDRTGPISSAIALRERLATASAATGDLQTAVDVLRRAQEVADSTRASAAVRAGLLLAGADLAMVLHQFEAGVRWYQEAERLFERSGDQSGLGSALSGRATLEIVRDDYDAAEVLLTRALRAQ